jgi:hypothetical protein
MREHAENPADMGPRCCSPAAAPRWLTGGSRAFPAPRRSTARIAASSPPARSPMLARHADGRPGPFSRRGLTGPADRRSVPAVCRRTRLPHGRPNALFCTNFARLISRHADQLAALAGARGQRIPVDPVPLGKGPACWAKPAPGPAHCRGIGARRPVALCGYAIRRAGTSPALSCPMCPSVLAYHRRDNVPGQIRAQIRPPGPSAKITQGARPLRQEPLHAT